MATIQTGLRVVQHDAFGHRWIGRAGTVEEAVELCRLDAALRGYRGGRYFEAFREDSILPVEISMQFVGGSWVAVVDRDLLGLSDQRAREMAAA